MHYIYIKNDVSAINKHHVSTHRLVIISGAVLHQTNTRRHSPTTNTDENDFLQPCNTQSAY